MIIVSVIGFVIASMLCGQATTLAQMVCFRLLQGAFGASVVPLSQAVMVDTFSAADRGKAMAIWGIGILLGPIMGPTVGGFITDHLDWRWVFYINLPIGIINLLLLAAFLQQTPPLTLVTADRTGPLLLALGVGALQMLLDRGNTEDWLESNLIVALMVVSLVCTIAFIIRSVRNPNAILKIDLLKGSKPRYGDVYDHGFRRWHAQHHRAAAAVPRTYAGLSRRHRRPPHRAGRYRRRVRDEARRHAHYPGGASLARADRPTLAAVGSYAMTWYNLDVDTAWIIRPGIVQGIGMGMIFVPLSTLAYQTLPKEASTERPASSTLRARSAARSASPSLRRC